MRRVLGTGLAALVVATSACQAIRPAHDHAAGPSNHRASSRPTTTTATPSPPPTATPPAPSSTPTPKPKPKPQAGTVPPPWLGTRALVKQANGFAAPQRTPPELRTRRFTLPDGLAPLPGRGFASRVVSPPPAGVLQRSTWQPGCPVSSDELAWVRLTFVGFDGARHTGELLVARSVAATVVRVFGRLYAVRFPIEEMRITRPGELTAAPTGDGNNTSAFVCRPMRGSSRPSAHASGLAIDVNPFQNPYEKPAGKPSIVSPELATAYVDRGWVRPGMIEPGGAAVRAFEAAGWTWGGSWHSSHDLMHFSATGQ